MGFPNSPLDPTPEVLGWPWHGLITKSGVVQSVKLPSGREVPCAAFGGHWTYLWDIGMPAPEVETADPDEQWLSKGVIRGKGYPGETWIYGGQPFGAGPIKLGAHVGASYLGYSFSSGVMRFEVTTVIDIGDGPITATKNLSMTAEVAGFDWIVNGQARYADPEIIDRLPDGTGSLIRITGFIDDSLYLSRPTLALIELRISGEFASMEASLTLVKGGTETQGVVTVDAEPPAYPAGVVVIGTPGVTPTRAAKVGTWITDSKVEAVVWAWYLPGGAIDLVRYGARVLITETITQSGTLDAYATSYGLEMVTTLTLTSNAGSASSVITCHTTDSSTESTTGIDITTSCTADIDGRSLVDASDSYSGPSNGSRGVTSTIAPMRTDIDADRQALLLPYWLVENYRDTPFGARALVGRQSLIALDVLSNKVLALKALYFDNPYQFTAPTVLPPCLLLYQQALTPSGVDTALYSRHSSIPAPLGRSIGCYNPITGAVARHLDSDLFSWV